MSPVNDRVGVEPDDEVVAVLAALLQESQVADVEEVEGSRHINNPVTLLWTLLDQGRRYLRMVMEGKGSTSALENSRSFWVVGKNWESPVHGERAAAPVLMSVEAFRSTW